MLDSKMASGNKSGTEVDPAMNRVNFYTGAGIDRVSPLRRDADWIANRLASPNARVLPVWREKNFVSFLDQGGKGEYLVADVMPVTFVFLASAAAMVIGSLFTQPPSRKTVDKFFPHST